MIEHENAYAVTSQNKRIDTPVPSDPRHHKSRPWAQLRIQPIDWELLPEELKKKSILRAEKYQETARAFYELSKENFGKSDINKAQIARNAHWAELIISNFHYIESVWQEVDFYMQKHRLKESPKSAYHNFDNLSLIELKKVLKYRTSNISTYRKRLQVSVEEPRKNKLKAKIEAFEKDIKAIKLLIHEQH